jgi:hypothetical protein
MIRRRAAEPQRRSGSLLSEMIAPRRPVLLVLLLTLAAFSCSIPNLEPPECDQARDVVREFYSLHFGNNGAFSPETLESRKGYLTPGFFQELKALPPAIDPFTRTDDPPKAFRAGECRVVEPGRSVKFEVVLFWKTDTRTEQRPISVDARNVDGKWLIERVTD